MIIKGASGLKSQGSCVTDLNSRTNNLTDDSADYHPPCKSFLYQFNASKL